MAEARRRVALLCACVPRELIEAAGFEALVVSGAEAGEAAEALAANLCPHARRAAALLGGPAGERLAGVVVADSCCPMLRLFDHLEAAGRPVPRWLLHVPRRAAPLSAAYLREQLARLGEGLAAAAGLPGLDGGRLAGAIAARNRWRERCAEAAEGLLAGRIARVTPELLEFFAGGAEALEAAAPRPVAAGAGRRRPRLLLAGSWFVTADLLALLADAGADVRALESCVHYRHGAPEVALGPGADPFLALAEATLAQPACPRMEAGGERAERAGRLAEAGAIDGVVYLLMKSCTPHAYAVPHWRRRLERAGAPLLVLEVEDADWSQPRLATRLEAFVESLATREAR